MANSVKYDSYPDVSMSQVVNALKFGHPNWIIHEADMGSEYAGEPQVIIRLNKSQAIEAMEINAL